MFDLDEYKKENKGLSITPSERVLSPIDTFPQSVVSAFFEKIIKRKKTLDKIRKCLEGEIVLSKQYKKFNEKTGKLEVKKVWSSLSIQEQLDLFFRILEKVEMLRPQNQNGGAAEISIEQISMIIRQTRIERGLPPDRNPD